MLFSTSSRLTVLVASVLVLLAACGSDAGDASCVDATCDQPPAATCDGEVRVTWLPFGACEAGACVYDPVRTACAFGCGDGVCLAEPTCGPCALPPSRCEGDVAVSFAEVGCDEGACLTDEVRVDCAADGAVCDAGRCVRACDDASCDAPPAASCDGNVAVTFAGGRCDVDGACVYTPERTPCGEDATCVDGACIATCGDVVCVTPPDASCDGVFAVTWESVGTCGGGVCSYASTRTNCVLQGDVCIAGACVPSLACDAGDPDACRRPPAPFCDGDVAFTPAPQGACVDDRCDYELTSINCATRGRYCFEGRCVLDDPCEGVTCDDAPAPRCDGNTVVVAAGAGFCAGGACSWAEARTPCPAGRFCAAGACTDTDPCSGITCDAPPANVCQGDLLFDYDGNTLGICTAGACRYDSFVQDCAAAGVTCRDGACDYGPLCAGVTCASPPPATCQGNATLRFASEGTCIAGNCSYRATASPCTGSSTCVGGVCVDLCEGITCGARAPVCDGAERITFTAGRCEGGACAYDATREPCDAVPGGYCNAGECLVAGFCENRVCELPPDARCEGREVVAFTSPGVCAEDRCTYPEVRTDCAASGRFCRSGACVDVDPCAGVACNDPPLDSCDGDVRVAWSTGLCTEGACDYASTRVDCATDGRVCVAGECIENAACDGIVCEPAPARCEGTVIVATVASECRAGSCRPDVVRTDCAATGRFCQGGACVDADPCAGLTCDAPPAPFCRGRLAVTSSLPGLCTEGACAFEETIVDCASTGGACRDGACVANACDGVTCDAPPTPFCQDDETLARFASPGVCSGGDCTYVFDPLACVSVGPNHLCRDGACRDACADVVCEPAPAATTCRDAYTPVRPVRRCERGVCQLAIDDETRCPAGEVCVNGACVIGDACDTVDCDVFLTGTCEDRFRRVIAGRVTCDLFACADASCPLPVCTPVEPTVTDCRTAGFDVCATGVCANARLAQAGDLVITELFATSTAGQQWFEIHNLTEDVIRLDGLVVDNAAGQAWTVSPAGTTVLPRGYHVFRQSAAAAPIEPPDRDESQPTYWQSSSFTMNRTADRIRIQRAGTTIAQVQWTAAWAIPATRSLQLDGRFVEEERDVTNVSNWCAPPTGVTSTPGSSNYACP